MGCPWWWVARGCSRGVGEHGARASGFLQRHLALAGLVWPWPGFAGGRVLFPLFSIAIDWLAEW